MQRRFSPWPVVTALLLASRSAQPDSPPADSLHARDSAAVALDRMIVTGQRPVARTTITVAEEEKEAGLKDDLGSIIYLQPGVERIPEAGSGLLINGQGLYDTRYLVYGVPMFSVSHFTNHVFCDRSGIFVPSARQLDLHTDDLAGAYADATGGVIAVDPGIVRIADPRLIPRPELAVNVGSLSSDLLLSVPFPGVKSMYQLSSRWVYDYTIQWLNNAPHLAGYMSANAAGLSGGQAGTFGDVVLAGENRRKACTVRQYAWLAYDVYEPTEYTGDSVVPWGMAAVQIADSSATPGWSIKAGGSTQPYREGKLMGHVYSSKAVARSNGAVTIDKSDIHRGPWSFTLRGFAEYLRWQGRLRESWRLLGDTDTTVYWYDSVAIGAAGGSEGRGEISGGIRRTIGSLSVGGTLLTGAVVPAAAFYADPGLNAHLLLDSLSFDLNAGIQSSLPDIRGLPDAGYRSRISKTYGASLGARWNRLFWLDAGAHGYVRWKDRCPQFGTDPWRQVWDPGRETPLLSRGIDLEVKISPFPWVSLSTIQQFSKAERVVDGLRTTYEWDLPWSNKSILHLSALENQLHVYLTGVVAEGLPYRDLVLDNGMPAYASGVSRSPVYKRIDIMAEYNQKIHKHRYLTRYDLYAEINNLPNFLSIPGNRGSGLWTNTREYYWDEYMNKIPIELDYFRTNIGGRIAFRL